MINDVLKQKMDEIAKTLEPRYAYSTIFNFAESYNQTAEMALARMNLTTNADFIAPAIMCRSFAVELLLKFYLVIDYPLVKNASELEPHGISLHGHKYSNLFQKIKQEYKTKIANKFSGVSGVKTTPEQFENHLLTLGDQPFVQFRYVYEEASHKYLNFELLSQVVDALGLTAQDLVRALKKKV